MRARTKVTPQRDNVAISFGSIRIGDIVRATWKEFDLTHSAVGEVGFIISGYGGSISTPEGQIIGLNTDRYHFTLIKAGPEKQSEQLETFESLLRIAERNDELGIKK